MVINSFNGHYISEMGGDVTILLFILLHPFIFIKMLKVVDLGIVFNKEHYVVSLKNHRLLI